MKTKVSFSLLVLAFCAKFSACQKSKPDDATIAEYCKLSCKGGKIQNTVCQFKCEPSDICKDSVKVREITDDDRQYVLDLHNHYRNLVASGKDRRGGNTKATNMMILNYDLDHEVTTYCWGVRCKWDHDKCRSTKKFGYCGQNLYKTWVTTTREYKSYPTNVLLKNAVEGWYDEITLTSRSVLKKYRSSPSSDVVWGHFTQLVWHEVTTVGCSVVYYKIGNDHTEYVLCNYGPGGNILSLPVYEFGNSATNCPSGTKQNDVYPGLCGELKIISENRTIISSARTCASLNIRLSLLVLLFITLV